MTVHSEPTAATQPTSHAQLLAELARSRSTAVLVQDALGAVHVLPYLNRHQVDDPDVVVLMTRDEAVSVLADAMASRMAALTAAGVLL